jgi:ribose/xylose/arabinose/galactoside ABC-type transport system permease subunit
MKKPPSAPASTSISGRSCTSWSRACCGLAAIIYLGQLNATHPSIGTGLELHIIAGTILGGTLLFGGYGSVGGMALGMFLIDLLENGLVLGGAGFFVQQIFLGILLITAVAAQLAQRRRRDLE